MIRTTRLPWIPKIHESKDSHDQRTRSKDSHNKADKDSNDKATKDSRDMADRDSGGNDLRWRVIMKRTRSYAHSEFGP